jgi:site-specific DNA recombinase
MKRGSAKPVRCAIYTRVSTDQGLEQDFNSLDAQYDASQAYIRSQAHAGWSLLRAKYEDGGFSGGDTDRPALQRLLDDVRAGKVDVIVVYKVDRLTRSLADFAKLVELFDKHGVSFVSVTQQLHHHVHGQIDVERAAVVRPIRARGHIRTNSGQDCRLQTQGSLGRRHGAARL